MKGKHPDYTVSTVVSTGGSELARECHQDTQLVPDLTVLPEQPAEDESRAEDAAQPFGRRVRADVNRLGICCSRRGARQCDVASQVNAIEAGDGALACAGGDEFHESGLRQSADVRFDALDTTISQARELSHGAGLLLVHDP